MKIAGKLACVVVLALLIGFAAAETSNPGSGYMISAGWPPPKSLNALEGRCLNEGVSPLPTGFPFLSKSYGDCSDPGAKNNILATALNWVIYIGIASLAVWLPNWLLKSFRMSRHE